MLGCVKKKAGEAMDCKLRQVRTAYCSELPYLCSLVALGGVVRLVHGPRAGRLVAVAHGGHGAVVLVLAQHALESLDEAAGLRATRTLARRALGVGPPPAAVLLVLLLGLVGRLARVAAGLGALVVVEAAVALLALLDDLVAAEGAVGLGEAVGLAAVGDGVENGRDVRLGAVRELVVVVPVARGRRGEHDEVSCRGIIRKLVSRENHQ